MISVFGATGFVGSKFCELYSNDVTKIPRESRKSTDKEVLYFISTIHNYNIFEDPHLDINTNLNLLVETLEEFRNNNPKKDKVFNFVSSWFVYGKGANLPAKETDYCNPTGFYSITKRAAEQLLISYCQTYDLNYRIFRLANVYGTGDAKASKKKNALQYMIEEVANNREINLYEGGTHLRDFIHVEDVCRAIRLCIDKASTNEIINIGTGKPTSIFYAMSYAKEQLNSSSKFNCIETPKFHKLVQVENMYLDISKLKMLNFEPKYSIIDGLSEIIGGYKNEQL